MDRSETPGDRAPGEERDLVERLRRVADGDEAALSAFIRDFHELAEHKRPSLKRLLGGTADLDDIVQTVLGRIVAKLQQGEFPCVEQATFRAYCGRALMNEGYTVLRRRRLGSPAGGDDSSAPQAPAAPSWMRPDAAVSSDERRAAIVRWLEQLSARDRFVLQQTVMFGKPDVAVAQELNLTPENVRKIRQRGLEALRQFVSASEN